MRNLTIVVLAVAAGCSSSDAQEERALGRVVRSVTVDVGGGGPPQVLRVPVSDAPDADVIELEVPGDVVPRRAQVQVSVVVDVPKRGRTPVNDRGVLVRPQMLTFDKPVKVRQRVPPPPPMRGYVSVLVPDGSDTFEARTPARRLAPAEPQGDGKELWEGDGTGSGLWGLAVE